MVQDADSVEGLGPLRSPTWKLLLSFRHFGREAVFAAVHPLSLEWLSLLPQILLLGTAKTVVEHVLLEGHVRYRRTEHVLVNERWLLRLD